MLTYNFTARLLPSKDILSQVCSLARKFPHRYSHAQGGTCVGVLINRMEYAVEAGNELAFYARHAESPEKLREALLLYELRMRVVYSGVPVFTVDIEKTDVNK
jgi:hypothetical protein